LRIQRLFIAIAVFTSLAACAQASTSDASVTTDEQENLSFGTYLAARQAVSEHDMAGAAKYYRESLERDPANTSLLALSFFYATSAGEVDEAGKLGERLIVTLPDDRASRLALAIVALKHRDYRQARDHLAKSAKGPFNSITVSLIDAWAAAGAGDAAGAEASLKVLRGQTGAEGLGAFHQALLEEYLGNADAADAAYRVALETAGDSARIVEGYGRFLERHGRAADATAFYTKAKEDAALAPIAADGLARIAKGDKPDALVARPQDGVAEALLGIAASLTDESSADVSILYLRLALYLRPNLDLASIMLGDRLETLLKYDDAIAVYRSIESDSPYYRMAAVQIAIDETRSDNNDAAIADLKMLTQTYSGDIETWTALGDAYRSAERFPEAAAAYDSAVKALGPVEKKDWPLFYVRAIAEERSHNWDAAEADLKQALALSPDEPEVLNYLGYSWIDQGRNTAAAIPMLEKARALKPLDGYIVDSVGWAYFRTGRYQDAAKILGDAVLLVPGDPTINDHLGDALWKVGRKIEARFQWNHALAFGADADEKSKLEKKLQVGLSGDDRS
jgi:tetratricopeptide (TPR) repeat protein